MGLLLDVVQLLAPTRCLHCAVPSPPPWCAGCRAGAATAPRGCSRCADPWPAHRCPFADGEVVASLALWAWTGSARSVVVAAKARGAWAGWGEHAGPLAAAVHAARWPVDVVVGVPTPAPVARRRGIAHGEVLAASVARRLGRPHLRALQAPPRRVDRVTGAAGAAGRGQGFQPVAAVRGQVLLVDDVLTTGATARQAARALVRAGAEAVRVAVLARGGRVEGTPTGSRSTPAPGP